MATIATVDEVLAAALAEAKEQIIVIIVDLRGLEFMDSSGLNLVFRCDQRAAGQAGLGGP